MNSRKQLKMTLFIVNPVLVLFLLSIVVNTLIETAFAGESEALQSYHQALQMEGEHNKVLNLMLLGKAALEQQSIDEAERAFEQVLVEIETIYANNENATKARSLWYEEGSKNFKGEPYERSMAYFYRGLIFLYKQEFDNARATFLSGLMQDAFAEEEQYRSDFALMMFLTGWASQKMGSRDLAQQAFDELKQFRPDFVPPPNNHDTLVIAETGKAPRKLADGLGHYELVFRRGKKIKDSGVDIVTDNGRYQMYPIEDIFWQASTRGGRPVDSIIEGKAQFKKSTEKTGSKLSKASNTAILVGAGLGNNTANNIGAAFSLVSVTSLALSANTKAKADTRYWSNLPDLVHIYTFDSAEYNSVNLLSYKDKKGKVLFEKSPELVSHTPKQTLIWSSNGAL